MSVQRQVATAADYIDIVATIPLHYLKVWLDADRNAVALLYKVPDDDFTEIFTTDASIGDIIERIGSGRNGLLGHPAAFSQSSQIATVLLKVKCSDSSVKDLNIFESESPL